MKTLAVALANILNILLSPLVKVAADVIYLEEDPSTKKSFTRALGLSLALLSFIAENSFNGFFY